MIFCAYHTTPTRNGPVCNLMSDWATTSGRLLCPKWSTDYLTFAHCVQKFKLMTVVHNPLLPTKL